MSLRIESVIVSVLTRVAPVVAHLKARNRSLADQLDRASASILLNTSEGAYSQKGHQKARYFSAMGSASETRSCLQLARAQHGIAADEAVHDELGHVIAVLWKLTR
jgi:four helix bundle protein